MKASIDVVSLATSYFETILVISSCVIVLLANSAFMDVRHSNLAIIGILITIALVFVSNKELWWKFLISTIFLIFIFQIFKIKGYAKGGKKTHRRMIFHAREEIFFEYVFQHIHNRASKWWSDNLENEKGFDPYEELEKRRNHKIDKEKI